jgi:hypothetical protein
MPSLRHRLVSTVLQLAPVVKVSVKAGPVLNLAVLAPQQLPAVVSSRSAFVM